jgi:carboxyvinyl-carboxyphosphonate phosphorylmutase
MLTRMNAINHSLEWRIVHDPIILGGGSILGDHAYLAGKCVRVSLQVHQPFQAAVRAIHDTLKALRDGTSPTGLKKSCFQ